MFLYSIHQSFFNVNQLGRLHYYCVQYGARFLGLMTNVFCMCEFFEPKREYSTVFKNKMKPDGFYQNITQAICELK